MEENQEESLSSDTLVAEYDATFLEIRDGYLAGSDGIASLSQGLANLLERGAEPTIDNSNIKEIWNTPKTPLSREQPMLTSTRAPTSICCAMRLNTSADPIPIIPMKKMNPISQVTPPPYGPSKPTMRENLWKSFTRGIWRS
jgi:hypothetical protein